MPIVICDQHNTVYFETIETSEGNIGHKKASDLSVIIEQEQWQPPGFVNAGPNNCHMNATLNLQYGYV